ncbi:MAG: MarC family protein [Leptospiraceae bacterium]|nr:MarC family protein [Leptospiraceae bacterium]
MDQFLLMLVIINPFAQVLYLADLMNELSFKDFTRVHLRATLLSLAVFLLFVVFGEALLHHVFQVQLASLQVFGGIIMLFIAYRYIAEGPGSNLLFRGEISELAPQISLPYMVGPGTIWVAILVGQQYPVYISSAIVTGVLVVNFLFVISICLIFERVTGRRETRLGKYFAILMRTNALFIGAIAMEMVVSGLKASFPALAG